MTWILAMRAKGGRALTQELQRLLGMLTLEASQSVLSGVDELNVMWNSVLSDEENLRVLITAAKAMALGDPEKTRRWILDDSES